MNKEQLERLEIAINAHMSAIEDAVTLHSSTSHAIETQYNTEQVRKIFKQLIESKLIQERASE